MRFLPENPEIPRDADGKTFRYRRNSLTTLLWCVVHPDQLGRTSSRTLVWFQVGFLALVLAFIAASFTLLLFYWNAGTSANGHALNLVVWLLLLGGICFHPGSHTASAVAHDLRTDICPACGYPLRVESESDGLADSMCSECGRKWNSGIGR